MLLVPFIPTISLSLSLTLSRCVTATVISLVIDHSSGWAPISLQSLEIWLWKDSINFPVRGHICLQWDTEHLCRPEAHNRSFNKATELSLPVSYHDTGSRCQAMMSFTQTAIHSFKILLFLLYKYLYTYYISTEDMCKFRLPILLILTKKLWIF